MKNELQTNKERELASNRVFNKNGIPWIPLIEKCSNLESYTSENVNFHTNRKSGSP